MSAYRFLFVVWTLTAGKFCWNTWGEVRPMGDGGEQQGGQCSCLWGARCSGQDTNLGYKRRLAKPRGLKELDIPPSHFSN